MIGWKFLWTPSIVIFLAAQFFYELIHYSFIINPLIVMIINPCIVYVLLEEKIIEDYKRITEFFTKKKDVNIINIIYYLHLKL